MSLPEDKAPDGGRHLRLWLKVYRPIARVVSLTTTLVLFLMWTPSQIRLIIWQGLSTRGIPSILLVAFSLLAVSLVWSASQRLDAQAFFISTLIAGHFHATAWVAFLMYAIALLVASRAWM